MLRFGLSTAIFAIYNEQCWQNEQLYEEAHFRGELPSFLLPTLEPSIGISLTKPLRMICQDVRELKQDASDQYTAEPLEDNLFEWHFTVRGPKVRKLLTNLSPYLNTPTPQLSSVS